ncbi:MAG: acetate/propionate family kinase [Bryobacteraceae bacterium]
MTDRRNGLAVLALNCGSSSLKFGVYQCEGDAAKPICEGEAEEIGRENSSFWVRAAGSEKRKDQIQFSDHRGALAHAMDALKRCGAPQPRAVGHRFVHGGPHIREHQRATAAVIDRLRAAVAFAPLHLPAALSVLEATEKNLPGVAQVVCLDTAFHRTMPDVSRTFALPAEVRKLGVERYGFHGLSLESIMAQLDTVPERLVAAHLGNGASITAIRNGKSIDTTMGLTPTGGIMMGTRCGDLDPGVLVYLMRNGYANPEMLEDLVNHRSGLLGVSGKSSDVRTLLSLRKQDAQVDLALRMFCYQARKAIAEMAAALGGLDALVFTGGIGEHAAEVREEICSGLSFLGEFRVMVLPSEEDLQIAKITAGLVQGRTFLVP